VEISGLVRISAVWFLLEIKQINIQGPTCNLISAKMEVDIETRLMAKGGKSELGLWLKGTSRG
jgi:hypothetical protein